MKLYYFIRLTLCAFVSLASCRSPDDAKTRVSTTVDGDSQVGKRPTVAKGSSGGAESFSGVRRPNSIPPVGPRLGLYDSRRDRFSPRFPHRAKRVFNYTGAVVKGRAFQLEVCPNVCPSTSHGAKNLLQKNLNRSSYAQRFCGICNCDENCVKYNDCCFSLADPSRSSKATTTTTCFEYKTRRGVAVVSSCPETFHSKLSSFAGALSNATESSKISFAIHARKCLNCTISHDKISFVVSNVTLVTYCNRHCLACNEPDLEPGMVLPWKTNRQCRAKAAKKSGKQPTFPVRRTFSSNTVGISRVCTLEFIPPLQGNSMRKCSLDTNLRKINDCPDGQIAGVDDATFRKIDRLCQSFYSPVYWSGKAFANIFCFLCRRLSSFQGHTPTAPDYRRGFSGSSGPEGELIFFEKLGLSLLSDVSGRYSNLDVQLENLVDNELLPGDDGYGITLSQGQADDSGTLLCELGTWYNYLVGNCTRPRCSRGRQLTSPNTSEPSSDQQRCILASKEDPVAGQDKVYILKVVWYVDSQESRGTGNDTDAILELDSFNDNGDDGDDKYGSVPRFGSVWHRNSSSFSCDALDQSAYGGSSSSDRGLSYRRTDSLPGRPGMPDLQGLRGRPPGHSRPSPPFANPPDYTPYSNPGESRLPDSIPAFAKRDSNPTHRLERSRDAVDPGPMGLLRKPEVDDTRVKGGTNESASTRLEIHAVNQTRSGLSQLNVSTFLLKLHPENKKEPLQLNHAREAVIFFQKSFLEARESQNEFDEQLVKVFSEKVEILQNGEAFKFRSILTQKHASVNKTNEILYLHFKGEIIESMDSKTFSESLSTMACREGVGKPVHINMMSTCPHVIFNTSEFNITSGQTLIHKQTNLRLLRHQYLQSKNGVAVCISVMDSLKQIAVNKQQPPIDALLYWEGLLTLILLPISMFCLLVTFATYCAFQVLRSMPGKNNAFLVFWLFWAQTLLLLNSLAPLHSTACVVMGIALHYSWLVTVAWTCVCSFHMFHVFVMHKGTSYADRSHKWYITRYCSMSHLAPLFIVITVCVASNYTTNQASIGYGGPVCYLNTPTLVGVAFLLPVALILVVNMAFFFSTVVAISRIEKMKRQTGIAEKRNTHVYARLSSLTSITWILAVLSEIPECEVLRVISVIVNSAQGVFIFVSYILNGRVKKLWSSVSRRDKKQNASVANAHSTASTKMYTLSATT